MKQIIEAGKDVGLFLLFYFGVIGMFITVVSVLFKN